MNSAAPRSGNGFHDDKDSNGTGEDDVHKTQSITATKSEDTRRGSLLQTPSWPIVRPLSPDTVSNLSIEEYTQLHPQQLLAQQNAGHHPKLPTGWRQSAQTFWKRNKGLAWMLIAQVFGTMMNVTIRLLEIEGNHGKGMHPIHILFARMVITLTLSSTYMWYMRTPDFPFGKPEVRRLLIARGFGGFFGVFGMYYALLYLPLADATVITFLAPSLACWACSILIKEPFTRGEQIGALISMVGVVLIAQPAGFFGAGDTVTGVDDSAAGSNATTSNPTTGDASNYDNVTPTQRLIAVGVSLLGVLGAATAYTTIRWIGKRAHPLISVNYFAAWCTFVSFTAQLVIPGIGFLLPATLKDWAYLIFLGICGFIMVRRTSSSWYDYTDFRQQFLLAAGLSYEKSSRSTNMAYTQMLFALAFDKLIFNHSPGWVSIIGSSLILGPAIVVAMQKEAGNAAFKQDCNNNNTTITGDEESRQGLLTDEIDETTASADNVQLQSIRR